MLYSYQLYITLPNDSLPIKKNDKIRFIVNPIQFVLSQKVYHLSSWKTHMQQIPTWIKRLLINNWFNSKEESLLYHLTQETHL